MQTPDRPELTAAESLLNDRCEALILITLQMPDAELTKLGQRAPCRFQNHAYDL